MPRKRLSRVTIVVTLFMLVVIVACGKKEQAEQQIESPTVTVADTSSFVPMDTTTAQEAEIKPEVVSSPDGNYTVQVSSWQTRRKAEKEAARFRAEGYDAYVQAAFLEDRKETWYRVRIGRYANSDDAARVADEIRALLESGFWIDRIQQSGDNN